MMNDGLHILSGAYAVHALPYAEWVLFEEHLVACACCEAEVRRLRETAARLAEAVAAEPPARLRARLIAAAHRVRGPGLRQAHDDSPTVWRPPADRRPAAAPPDAPTLALPGAVPLDPGNSPTLGLPPDSGRGSVVGLPSGVAPPDYDNGPTLGLPPERRPAVVTGAGTPVPAEGGEVVPLRRRRTKVLAGLAAASVAAAVAFGVVALDARRDLGELGSRNSELLAVLAAPDAATVRQPVTAGGTGTVVISRARKRMIFTAWGLPDLPDAKAYELWLMDDDGPRPAGMLAPAHDGLTPPILVTPKGGDARVALTVEPVAGSERPTTQPILLAELPSA
ncbi:anti-sigma factor [Nonomuraea sp. NPDC002799]